MSDDPYPLLDELGPVIQPSELTNGRAATFAGYLVSGRYAEVRLLHCRHHAELGWNTVVLDINVERPQVRACDIRRVEPIALVFRDDAHAPSVLSARPDFPDTPHQNMVPVGSPRSPCVDERPWAEARSSWTPFACLERIRWWLGAAVAGDLTGDEQTVEPLYLPEGFDIVLPRDVIAGGGFASRVLWAWLPSGHPRVALVRTDSQGPHGPKAPFRVLVVHTQPQDTGTIRNTPRNLQQLVDELDLCGVDLLALIKAEMYEALNSNDVLHAKLVIVLAMPLRRGPLHEVERLDLKAFGTSLTVGEVGCKLGWLDVGHEGGRAFVRALGEARAESPGDVPLMIFQVHLDFDRELAVTCSGCGQPDKRKVVLIGAGAVGSHVAVTLLREGHFTWTVVDNDWMLPHNLARHVGSIHSIGLAKAFALAAILQSIGGTTAASGLVADFLSPEPAGKQTLDNALSEADVIIDAAASIAVSRRLADADSPHGRRVSVFLNPAGTASILLAEDADRHCWLDAIEGQYYRLLLRSEHLREHLAPPPAGYRYAGACRAVTNRIPEANVTILAGLVSRRLREVVDQSAPAINVWSLSPSGAVQADRVEPSTLLRIAVSGWTVVIDNALLSELRAERATKLPHETGGILVGVVDTERRVIVIVEACPAPPDSVGSGSGFERGVQGLARTFADMTMVTGGQVRYVGEWHSHPPGHSALPSAVDVRQLVFLRSELVRESLPPLMLIVGEQNVTLLAAEDSEPTPHGTAESM